MRRKLSQRWSQTARTSRDEIRRDETRRDWLDPVSVARSVNLSSVLTESHMTVVSHLYVWYDTPRSGVYGAVSLSRYVMSRISGQDKLSVGPDKISIWLSSFCSYVQVFFVPDLGFSEGGQTGGGRTRPKRQSFRLERQRDGMGFGRGGQRALYPLHSPKILYDNLSFLVSTAGKIKLKAVNKNTATVCNSKFNCTLFLSLSMKCNCATSYE